jgi:hypothetical protein
MVARTSLVDAVLANQVRDARGSNCDGNREMNSRRLGLGLGVAIWRLLLNDDFSR